MGKKASNEAPSMDLTEPKPTETTTDASESKTDVVEMSESKIDVVEMSESKIDAVEVSKSEVDAIERNLNVGEDNTSAKEEETKGVEKTVEATNTKINHLRVKVRRIHK